MGNKISNFKNNKNIIVVMRGTSAVTFHKKTNLLVQNIQSSIGPVNINYTTRWLKKEDGIVVPGHIWIEVSGFAQSLEEALVPFANASLTILPILSISANAAISDPNLEIGFDNTKGITERDYFQCYIPPENNEIYNLRCINIKATIALLDALDKHLDKERLIRAANQYRLALDYWRLGRETLSLAHLWMSIEALTKTKVRAECKVRNLKNEKELAAAIGINIENLDPYIRKELLLKGDNDCYMKAKKASDGFEHGFLSYKDIIKSSKDVRRRMAEYTRTAIIELCELEEDKLNVLLTKPFNKPLGCWPIVKYLRGKLIGKGDQLAAEDNAYPFMKWKPTIKSASVNKNGQYNITIKDSIIPELGQGISFKPISREIWQAD
ncbi:MAG: hypothetical protein KAV97_00930 [Actinomycetia bacterium]|nr:hypothetical protein [Actinomycetes bacterium]